MRSEDVFEMGKVWKVKVYLKCEGMDSKGVSDM